MGRSVPHNLKSTHQTEFVKIFNSLCGRYGRWEIWQDFITLAAIAISNTVDQSQAAEREKTYMTIAGKYKPEEMLKFSQMLQEVVIGMDFNPDQDFLGELYMALDLGNDHAGQFFTPYDVCRMMAEITGADLQARIERDGWISVNDCACGAGALLVAFANACTRQEINYQTSVLFTAQDIDYIVGLMCYLQLSLMGCAGYVVIGDTLLHPSTALDRRGLIPRPDQNIWYTPFYFRDIWHYRRVWNMNHYEYELCENSDLDHIYEILETLGYEKSDDEEEMAEGTHRLFDTYGAQPDKTTEDSDDE